MSRPAWSSHLAAVVGYVCVAVAFSWPLALHLSTHFTGDPGGDTGVYVWNQWVFWHGAAVEHRNPLTTELIFSMTGRPVDLSQHNYTLFTNVLAAPLLPWLGVVTTFNLTLLVARVLTAWCTFVLARRVSGGATLASWLAGAAFAWSPVIVARATGHFSLVAAAPLAAFLWALHRVDRSRSVTDGVLAGLTVAWAATCDPYFAVYCVDIAALYVLARLFHVRWGGAPVSRSSMWLLNLGIALAAGLVAGLLAGRGGRFEVLGVPVSIRGLYAPVMLLTLLVSARVLFALRPRLEQIDWPRPRTIGVAVAGALAGVVALSPTLIAAARRLADGTWVEPPTLWRSSPPGVDLLSLLGPNPAHPHWRFVAGDWQATAPTVFVEFAAGMGLVSLLIVAFAIWRASLRPTTWLAAFAVFAALALGPFVHVAGVNTYVPGPWAFLRYVPILNLTRMPGRFAILACLLLSVMLALALQALSRRWPSHRRTLLIVAGVLLAVELFPAPRPLYSARVPAVYDIVRDDPRPVRVLELPFGVRDGVDSEGGFSARYQYHQTYHGKRLIGGYLSRVSKRRFREISSLPTLHALQVLSEDRSLTDGERADADAHIDTFLGRANIGWVVMHPSRTSPALEQFAVERFALERVAADGDAVLYRPRRGPAALPATP